MHPCKAKEKIRSVKSNNGLKRRPKKKKRENGKKRSESEKNLKMLNPSLPPPIVETSWPPISGRTKRLEMPLR